MKIYTRQQGTPKYSTTTTEVGNKMITSRCINLGYIHECKRKGYVKYSQELEEEDKLLREEHLKRVDDFCKAKKGR